MNMVCGMQANWWPSALSYQKKKLIELDSNAVVHRVRVQAMYTSANMPAVRIRLRSAVSWHVTLEPFICMFARMSAPNAAVPSSNGLTWSVMNVSIWPTNRSRATTARTRARVGISSRNIAPNITATAAAAA